MNGLLEYVREFGCYDYQEKKLCVEDMLAFAQLSYLKFDNFIPGIYENKRGISLKALSSHPGQIGLFELEWLAKENEQLFGLMARSERYGEVILRNYSKIEDKRHFIQFAAIMYLLPEGKSIVAYRGTDELLAGWIEDSRLAFDRVIPGQEFAKTYLRILMKKENIKYVIGHSKGGNLAEYAVSNLPNEMIEKIEKICNFDGPSQQFANNSIYKIKDKYIKIVPKASIVGMLFEKIDNVHLIKSFGIGIMQHNLYFWTIKHGKLLRVKKSKRVEKKLNKITLWIQKTEYLKLQRLLNGFSKQILRSGTDNILLYIQHFTRHYGSKMGSKKHLTIKKIKDKIH